jgi:hypothetical protein
MKKLLYILAFTIVAAASLSSCTEEVVKPKEGSLGGVISKD